MSAGTVHNVGEYAPSGYRLVASNYEGGAVVHVFEGTGPRLELLVKAGEDERVALAGFRRLHLPSASEPLLKSKGKK